MTKSSVGNRFPLLLAVAIATGVTLALAPGDANAFRAKYYKDCYRPVADVENLVEEDDTNLADTAGAVSEVAGFFGGFGGLGSAARTAHQVASYSGTISDVAGFTEKMQDDHPDPNDRFAAYGSHMSQEAQDLQKVEVAVGGSQICYEQEYDALAQQVATGEMKSRKAGKRLSEIQKGARASGDVLLAALERLNKNADAYGQAAARETSALGISLPAGGGSFGTLSSLARYGSPRAVGVVGAQMALEGAVTQANLAQQQGQQANSPAYGGQAYGNQAYGNQAYGNQGYDDQAYGQPSPYDQGLSSMGQASEEYLAVREAAIARADQQRLLELKVNQQPW